MGGSVVTRACPILLERKYKVGGVAVLDVVEGTVRPYFTVRRVAEIHLGSAIEALPHMHSLLNARPDGFDSMEEAIEWQYVCWPSTLSLALMAKWLYHSVTTKAIRNPNSARVSIPGIIVPSNNDSPAVPPFVWRTPLRSTAPYWTSK